MKHFKIEVLLNGNRYMKFLIEAETKKQALKVLNKALRKETFKVTSIMEQE